MGHRGIALPAALLVLLALYVVSAGAAHQSLTIQRLATHHDAYQRAFAAADGALQQGVEALGTAYESGAALGDTLLLVSDSLGGLSTAVRSFVRREPPGWDLNGNGLSGEVIRYERAWGFASAVHAGGLTDPGEPVRIVVASARGRAALEEVLLEVAFERDPAVADPRARGAWRAVPLRWSAIVGHR